MKISPNPKPFRYSLGARGEILAAEFLQKQGFRILFRNYRCRLGEIDLVAEKAGRIHFVEVKARSGRGFGDPAEAVDLKKQAKLLKLAAWFLKERRLEDPRVSLDVVTVLAPVGTKPEIKLIEGAFEKEDERY